MFPLPSPYAGPPACLTIAALRRRLSGRRVSRPLPPPPRSTGFAPFGVAASYYFTKGNNENCAYAPGPSPRAASANRVLRQEVKPRTRIMATRKLEPTCARRTPRLLAFVQRKTTELKQPGPGMIPEHARFAHVHLNLSAVTIRPPSTSRLRARASRRPLRSGRACATAKGRCRKCRRWPGTTLQWGVLKQHRRPPSGGRPASRSG